MDDLLLYLRLARATLSGYAARPVLLITGMLGAAMAAGVEVVAIVLLLGRFGRLGGWDAHEVALLLGLAECGLAPALALAWRLETSTFAALVTSGEFDAVLTRPISPLLWVLASDVQAREIGRFTVGVGTVVWAGGAGRVHWSPAAVGIVLLSAASCAVVLMAVHILGAAVTFRTGQGTEFVNALIFGGVTLASNPMQIFDVGLRVLFVYVVPVALTVYVPALHLLGRTGPPLVPRALLPAAPLAAALLLGLSLLAWRGGVRHYQRTGG